MHNLNYFPGQRIVCRGEEWEIKESRNLKTVNGQAVWELVVVGQSGIVADQMFTFLDILEDDLKLLDPTDITPVLDESKKGFRTRIFLESHLRRLLPRNGAIYLGQHGACDLLPYQLEPAAKALHMVRPRILIGDSVGLGKTIECGILLSELIRRGKGRRILCAVPKAILEQFQLEMWGRFAIPFHRLDSKGLEKLRQDLPSSMNPFFYYDKVIISIDTLKQKKFQKLLEESNWDVLVVDEAHNVADRTGGMGGNLKHRLVKRISEQNRCKAVIMMSATPHDGTIQGFTSLIKILDKTAIGSEDITDTDKLKNEIKAAREKYFIRRTRASIAAQLSNRKERVQKTTRIPLSEAEIQILQRLHDIKFESKFAQRSSKAGVQELFKTTLIKSFLSSPFALEETVTKKLNSIEKSEVTNASIEKDSENLRNVLSDVGALKGKHSRIESLIKYIKENPTSPDNRLVIFTERLATMKALTAALKAAGVVNNLFDAKEEKQASGKLLALADGSYSDVDLNKIVKAFQNDQYAVHILIATNVASEGLNLHDRCHRLIHFDLPWSLITLEQRNGRIDRLGQTQQPEIHYFASVANTQAKNIKLEKLKDDFWIVEKIEARMRQAGHDMDEEALSQGLHSGEEEESRNTERYENGTPAEAVSSEMSFFETLMSEEDSTPTKPQAYKGELPTLFESSPDDFVRGVCQAAKIPFVENQHLALTFDSSLKHEFERWPIEYRPQENVIKFEPNSQKMADHYKNRKDQGLVLEKTFLNEIHPALNLLENAALGLFDSNKVPVVSSAGVEPASTVFLVQATLLNKKNEVVHQSWQLLNFEKGQNDCHPLFEKHPKEPNHTKDLTHALVEIFEASVKNEVGEFELKRIQKLAGKALSWMKQTVSEVRDSRAIELKPALAAELKRIENWESERRNYLNKVQVADSSVQWHAGMAVQANHAKAELEQLNEESIQYKKFITDVIATQADPVLKILAVFKGV